MISEWVKVAKIGDEVELVVDLSSYAERAASDGIVLPAKGRVYTIREFEAGSVFKPWVYLRFRELVNGPSRDGIEPSFYSEWFRPIVRTSGDISVFTRMLVTTDKPLEVETC